MDDIVFNVILLKGEDGNSITSIEKTGTSGNTDTYTVTLTDGSTYTFDVTNGSDISSIEKTDTSGLVDTYTVTLTDGSTTTFEVTNGNGITSIEKTGTSGNTDTYTITLENGNTSTFTVTNGTNAVDDALSTTSTNPVENRVVTNAINNINQHLKYSGNANGSDYSNAVQNLILLSAENLNPASENILDIVGYVSITGSLGSSIPCYGSLGCSLNATGKPTLIGVISTSSATYRVVATKATIGGAWSNATVTLTEI